MLSRAEQYLLIKKTSIERIFEGNKKLLLNSIDTRSFLDMREQEE